MTENELGRILKDIYDNAPQGYQGTKNINPIYASEKRVDHLKKPYP